MALHNEPLKGSKREHQLWPANVRRNQHGSPVSFRSDGNSISGPKPASSDSEESANLGFGSQKSVNATYVYQSSCTGTNISESSVEGYWIHRSWKLGRRYFRIRGSFLGFGSFFLRREEAVTSLPHRRRVAASEPTLQRPPCSAIDVDEDVGMRGSRSIYRST